MDVTHLVVGGGTAGCVLAARLSENPANTVLLVEAGPDIRPDAVPEAIRRASASLAIATPAYFWNTLKVRRGGRDDAGPGRAKPVRYTQARLLGGGSSINGQISAWNAPRDFDRWEELGAEGWNWAAVEPCFRKLETDLDFPRTRHGETGPIRIRREPPTQWDALSKAASAEWSAMGFPRVADANADFTEGISPLPFAHDGEQRMSAAIAYLDGPRRRAPNLSVRANTEIARILLDGRRAVGVECADGTILTARNVILSAGALNSPRLLMLSGIGPGDHLKACGIPVLLDLPGVGANLQNHATLSIAGYLPRPHRPPPDSRGMYLMLRYSSNLADCPPADMWMTTKSGVSWHAVGRRLGVVTAFLGKAFSRGEVRLSPSDPKGPPDIHQNLLSDPRDCARMTQAYLMVSSMLARPGMRAVLADPFLAVMSERVHRAGVRTWRNAAMTAAAGTIMDMHPLLRTRFIDKLIAESPRLDRMRLPPEEVGAHVRRHASSAWHDCGTCRMGSPSDASSVTDSRGKVIGMENLYVADASIMPEIPTTNTNLPTVMIGERIADMLKTG